MATVRDAVLHRPRSPTATDRLNRLADVLVEPTQTNARMGVRPAGHEPAGPGRCVDSAFGQRQQSCRATASSHHTNPLSGRRIHRNGKSDEKLVRGGCSIHIRDIFGIK